MSDCRLCGISDVSICSVLSAPQRDELSRHGRIQTVRRGQALLWEGEDALLVANVVEGVLKLSTATSDGREQIVGVVYPAEFIGHPFRAGTSSCTVTALVDSRVCLFSRAAFDSYARAYPELAQDLLRRTLDELDHARRWMLLLGRKSAGERVASFLLELSARLAAADTAADGAAAVCMRLGRAALDRFELPLSRQQIGDLLGLTIETVSRQFSALKAAGAIDLPGGRAVAITDRAALIAIAGD
jgi:CRP/FNR family transcriptional regulator